MRFKANLHNPKHLQHILQAIDKIDKTCTIRLSRESIVFIVKSDAKNGTEVWCKVAVHTLFNDYRVESLNNNYIHMDVHIKNVLQVLSSCSPSSTTSVKQVLMKLTKKHRQPYLTCEILSTQTHGQLSQNITIVQDIPVRVLAAQETENLKELPVGDCRVQIVLPQPLKELKTIIDRMKSLTKSDGTLMIHGNMSGTLELLVSTTLSTARTVFSNLAVKDLGNGQTEAQQQAMEDEDSDFQSEKVMVDIKRIAKFIHVHVVQPDEVVLALTPNILIFNATIAGGYITYYIGCNQISQI